jgi:hypothetical protein
VRLSCAVAVRLLLTFYIDALTKTHVNCTRVQSRIPTSVVWLHRSSCFVLAAQFSSLEGSTSRLGGDNDWLASVDWTAGCWLLDSTETSDSSMDLTVFG